MPLSENDVMNWNRVGPLGAQSPRCSWKGGDEEAAGVGGGLAVRRARVRALLRGVVGVAVAAGLLAACDSPSEPPEPPVISGEWSVPSPVFFGDRASYEGVFVATPGEVTGVQVGERSYSGGVVSGETAPLTETTCVEAVVSASNREVTRTRRFERCVAVEDPVVGEFTLSAPSRVVFDEEIEYTLSGELTTRAGAVAVDSVVARFGAKRRVYETLPVAGAFTPVEFGVTESLEVVVYGELRNNGRSLPVERRISRPVEVGPELAPLRIGFEGFFYGGSHSDVELDVIFGSDTTSVPVVEGIAEGRVPLGEVALRPRAREGSDFVHLVDGLPHEYHLLRTEGRCLATDVVRDHVVLAVDREGVEGVVYSVPTSVHLIKAAQMYGNRDVGFEGVNTFSGGAARTLDRRQSHTVLFIHGPEVAGNPFEMRPADFYVPDGRAHVLEAYEVGVRAFSHPSVPSACLAYGDESMVREFLSLREVTPQYFLDNLWDGRVSSAEGEPTSPGGVDFFHYTWIQGRLRASSGNSFVDGVLRTVDSEAATPSFGPGNWLSEWQWLGVYDTRVTGCGAKNRSNLRD